MTEPFWPYLGYVSQDFPEAVHYTVPTHAQQTL